MQDQRPETGNPRGQEPAGGAVEGAALGEPPGGRREEGAARAARGAAWEAGPCDGGASLEPNSSWGDFEGFSEAAEQADTFSSLDLVGRWAAPGERDGDPDLSAGVTPSRGCPQPDGLPSVSDAAAASPVQANLSYENIFKLVFQEVPVQQMTEDICTLHHFLEKHNEENTSCKPVKKQFCSESQKLWRILQDEDGTSTSKCLWSKSHCQDNFLLVLGIDAAQKGFLLCKEAHKKEEEEEEEAHRRPTDLSGGKNHVLGDSNLKETEELTEVNGFNLNNCKALIQTKLSGSSAPRHNSLFMYNLFLKKTPTSGNMQYITIPRKKKLFTARNLKMKFFNSDVC